MVVNVCFILSNIVQKDNALFICHKKQLTCVYTTFFAYSSHSHLSLPGFRWGLLNFT